MNFPVFLCVGRETRVGFGPRLGPGFRRHHAGGRDGRRREVATFRPLEIKPHVPIRLAHGGRQVPALPAMILDEAVLGGEIREHAGFAGAHHLVFPLRRRHLVHERFQQAALRLVSGLESVLAVRGLARHHHVTKTLVAGHHRLPADVASAGGDLPQLPLPLAGNGQMGKFIFQPGPAAFAGSGNNIFGNIFHFGTHTMVERNKTTVPSPTCHPAAV